jgi:hypothetical protein
LKNRFGSRNYAAEELIAELGAAFLCAEFGFDGDVRNAGYIASWTRGHFLQPAAKRPRRRTTCAVWPLPSLQRGLRDGTAAPAPRQRARHAPIFDVHPQTGIGFEVFYSDRSLETFGKAGEGWFWWSRRRGSSPEGPAIGPFATSYAAYRNATTTGRVQIFGRSAMTL